MTNGFDIFQSFDPTSAFFTKVVNKKKKAPTQESSQSSSKKDRSREKAHHGGKSEEEVRVKGISIIISVVYFDFQPVLHDWCNKMLWCVLSCLWDGAYKRPLAANRKE